MRQTGGQGPGHGEFSCRGWDFILKAEGEY